MAGPTQDPLETMINDGKVSIRPVSHYQLPTIIDVDLEILHTALLNRLQSAYSYYDPLHNQYSGTENEIRFKIDGDLESLLDLALAVTYNRLRNVLQRYDPKAFCERMNNRAPVSNKYEFPTFLSSLLGSIGPLRIHHVVDMLIVYATASNYNQNYGRSADPNWNVGRYTRITDALAAAGVSLSPIDVENVTSGSFFTTVDLHRSDYVWNCFGTVHSSHYENEDIACALMCAGEIGSFTNYAFLRFPSIVIELATNARIVVKAVCDNAPAGNELLTIHTCSLAREIHDIEAYRMLVYRLRS